MAPITNLYSTYSYIRTASNLPIVAVMHGYGGSAYTSSVIDRMARYGAFVISPGMRGRNSADGTPDASGREIYDIYDAIEKVKTDYAAYVDATRVCIVGYSGGGGNALAFACKFPDYANVIVSHFGISDYGWADVTGSGLDAAWGWYPNESVNLAVGGLPDAVPNNYRARNAIDAIANFSGGHLYLYHDEDDTTVTVIHSQRIAALMPSNSTTSITTAASSPRWIHGNPIIGDAGEPNIQTEPIWLQAVADKTRPAWTIPASGTITVIGYVVTKRFSIWLNTGLDAAATVVYDTAAGTYTVTPITSNAVVAVSIVQGALTASGNTNGATLFTVT